MASCWTWCWRSIEAASGFEPHEETNRLVTKQLRKLNGIITCVEHKDWRRAAMRVPLEQGTDVCGSDLLHIVSRFHALGRQWRTPTIVAKAELGEPLIRPPRENGLACGMAAVMVIITPLGAGFRVVLQPC
jgi:hypothetical protein